MMKVKSDMKTDDKSVHVKQKPLSELAGIEDIDFSEKKNPGAISLTKPAWILGLGSRLWGLFAMGRLCAAG